MRKTLAMGLLTSVASLIVTAACSNDDDCTLNECINNVTIHLRVEQTPEAMRDSLIQVCRNKLCAEGKPETLPTQPNNPQRVFLTKGELPAEVTLDLPRTGNVFSITVVVPLDAIVPAPTDLYELRVSHNGKEVKGIAQPANYEQTTPNGPECPSVCTNAIIGTP